MLRFKSVDAARQYALDLIEQAELEQTLALVECSLAVTKLQLSI